MRSGGFQLRCVGVLAGVMVGSAAVPAKAQQPVKPSPAPRARPSRMPSFNDSLNDQELIDLVLGGIAVGSDHEHGSVPVPPLSFGF